VKDDVNAMLEPAEVAPEDDIAEHDASLLLKAKSAYL
jgi:hypothetical protein